MTVDRRTAAQDAHHYWRQFPVNFYFDKPGDRIAGVLVAQAEEGPIKDPIPKIRLQAKDGRQFDVIAHQERLKAELVKAAPVIGDYVQIAYTGDAAKAAQGMTKAKLFTVEVTRPGSQAPERTERIGGSASENVPGSGESSS